MKAQIKIDRSNRTILVNSGFAKRADLFNTAEYHSLQQCRQDYPDFKVVTRHIRTNPNKECYRGLTYEYMEYYIRLHEENPEETLFELSELKLISQCHSKARRYPAIKKWFLEKYPEVENFSQFNIDFKPEQGLALSERNTEVGLVA